MGGRELLGSQNPLSIDLAKRTARARSRNRRLDHAGCRLRKVGERFGEKVTEPEGALNNAYGLYMAV